MRLAPSRRPQSCHGARPDSEGDEAAHKAACLLTEVVGVDLED